MPRATTKRTTKPSRPRKPARAPAGLVQAFQLLRESDTTPAYALQKAAEVFPVAQRILRELQSDADQRAVDEILNSATDAMFPDWNAPAHTEPELAQTAAYYIGFAVCWLLLSQMQVAPR